MRGSVFQALWKTKSTAHVRPRGRNYDIPQLRVRYNSSTTTPTTNPPSTAVPAKPKKPSLLVTHGEAIFRLILVSQATFGFITAFWWHMHYFETQDEKNEEIATLKRELKRELQLQIDKREAN